MGARLAGMRPDLGPLDHRIDNPGLNALEMIESASKTGWDFLYIAGANLAKKIPSSLWKEARAKTKFLVVQDLFQNETAQEADLILPTLSYVEKGGSFMNIEGRIQTLMPGKEVPNGIYADGEIFNKIAQKLNISLSIDQNLISQLKNDHVRPFLSNSIHLPMHSPSLGDASTDMLFATFTPALFDNGVRMKHDPHVFWLAKEARVRIHPNEGIKRGIHDDEKVYLIANGNKIEGKIRWDENVAQGTVVLPLGFDGLNVRDLGISLMNGMQMTIQRG